MTSQWLFFKYGKYIEKLKLTAQAVYVQITMICTVYMCKYSTGQIKVYVPFSNYDRCTVRIISFRDRGHDGRTRLVQYHEPGDDDRTYCDQCSSEVPGWFDGHQLVVLLG